MMEDKLRELKAEYQKIGTPGYLISNGWLDLSLKLPEKGKLSWRLFFGRGLVFASIVLVFGGSVVGISQAAKPGDLLFPVKVLSEKVAEKVVDNPDISVVRRADDLIDQSKKDPEGLDKASEEYNKTLEESRQDAQKSGRTQEFKNTLDEQEKKLNEAQNNEHQSEEIQKAIDETERVRGEVKGEKDSDNSEDRDSNDDSGEDSTQNKD